MKNCKKCLNEINDNELTCPYCGGKQDNNDFLSDINNSLNEQIENKITLENEQEKFKLFNYEKVSDDDYIIKGLKNKYVYKVDVPEGIVVICEEAFANSKVIEVKLPETLIEIEARAFKNCIHLKSINIPNSVSIIGDEVFANCSKLNVEINELIDLGQNALSGTLYEKIKLEQKEKELAERRAKEEAEQKAKEEAERRAKEEAEKKAFEERIKILHKRKNEFDINAFLQKNTFGRYPQTKVTDSYIINALNQIITINEYGYIEYDGNEYKEYNDNYYLVEPIKWKILETNNNSYKLVSDLILDQQQFYSGTSNRTINGNTIYPNNYEYSDIRAWLNNDFINAAFNTEEQNIIKKSLVDNSAPTTMSNTNKCACNNTNDKVYLLSYKDVTEKYFKTDSERQAKVTDYAKDKGVHENNGLGDFWLRSPYYDLSNYFIYVTHYGNSDSVSYVGSSGSMSDYYCDRSFIGARPALEIKIK